MLFDIRGRRKHVVRVVYAILALLMGASLFVAVGPFNISELLGTGGTTSADEVFDEQIERIESRLAKEPTDEDQLVALIRAEISAGNARTGTSLESETPEVPVDARENYEEARRAWNRYLEQAGEKEANPIVAQLVASTFFRLAEAGSVTLAEIEANVDTAAEAGRIAAAQRANLGTLSSLAIYEYFDGNFKAGDEATKRAMAEAPEGAEAKNIEKQLNEYRKSAKKFVVSLKQFAKAEKEAGGGQVQNPFEGAGSGIPGAGLGP